MSDEYDREEHQENCLKLVENIIQEFPSKRMGDLGEACYSFSELGLWNDAGISIDPKLAIQIWAVVEMSLRGEWNDELRM